ncbi:hypothetical protein OXB_0107 [Bacillus sp. OxB-1]|uniref:hypothetical protein n=1 Tax=Bacillus sp. (strain OxB-1) TaxID=98228 RepID=UPI0005821238|nr:hypothetical protein [Bacillus sp. OxB-1]BAQ08579.1 hypothetical protein OXB_0107 [Bacillus sp. OxB-1]
MTHKTDLKTHSVEAFLNTLIDYAGLFPPAKLPLDQAIRNYASYVNGEDAWIVGPFVIPAASLDQLDEHISLFTEERPLLLSVLGRKGEDEATSVLYMEDDFQKVEELRERYGKVVQVDFFEVAMPSLNPGKPYLEKVQKMMAEHRLTCYAELPIQGNDPTWSDSLSDVLSKVSSINKGYSQPLGAKLRSGGITAELIPSIEIVASFIHGCKEHKVPCKFTAGLHHPIRMYREEVGTKMHGFVNVFAAGLLAYVHNLEKPRIMEILRDQAPSSFSFQPEKLVWNELEVSVHDMKELRERYLCSYGSCSFDEPRDELRALDIIERG